MKNTNFKIEHNMSRTRPRSFKLALVMMLIASTFSNATGYTSLADFPKSDLVFKPEASVYSSSQKDNYSTVRCQPSGKFCITAKKSLSVNSPPSTVSNFVVFDLDPESQRADSDKIVPSPFDGLSIEGADLVHLLAYEFFNDDTIFIVSCEDQQEAMKLSAITLDSSDMSLSVTSSYTTLDIGAIVTKAQASPSQIRFLRGTTHSYFSFAIGVFVFDSSLEHKELDVNYAKDANGYNINSIADLKDDSSLFMVSVYSNTVGGDNIQEIRFFDFTSQNFDFDSPTKQYDLDSGLALIIYINERRGDTALTFGVNVIAGITYSSFGGAEREEFGKLAFTDVMYMKSVKTTDYFLQAGSASFSLIWVGKAHIPGETFEIEVTDIIAEITGVYDEGSAPLALTSIGDNTLQFFFTLENSDSTTALAYTQFLAACHESCENCSGPEENECLSCFDPLKIVIPNDDSTEQNFVGMCYEKKLELDVINIPVATCGGRDIVGCIKCSDKAPGWWCSTCTFRSGLEGMTSDYQAGFYCAKCPIDNCAACEIDQESGERTCSQCLAGYGLKEDDAGAVICSFAPGNSIWMILGLLVTITFWIR